VADKLVLITRSDLRPGQQAVQAAHAMRQFAFQHPDADRVWFEQSNTLALLAVPDEEALRRLADRADDRDLKLSLFREPDLDNALTAIALEPGHRSQRLCRNLPLALGG
jgi:peptidyl-tRNA hydrolase